MSGSYRQKKVAFTHGLLSLVLALGACGEPACPTGYARIPADGNYIKADECLARHEMRQINGLPEPIDAGERWKLPHDNARKACADIGYSLPSNDLWQAMARNAELVETNWQDGRILPSVTLSNGEILYHVGDSGWEQIGSTLTVNPQINGLKIEQLADAVQPALFSVGSGTKRTAKGQFGPSRTYSGNPGLGIATTYRNIYIMRGGDDQEPGLFGIAMNHGADGYGDDIAFRCACPLTKCKARARRASVPRNAPDR